MKLLTHSALRVARSCLRMHELRYELGYVAVHEANATRFGSLVHDGLEQRMQIHRSTGEERDLGPHLARSSDTWDAWTPDLRADDPWDHVCADELLRGYHARWYADLAEYEVLAVEVEFRASLRNPGSAHGVSRTWQLAGKIDGIVRELATGRVLLVEHKTSSEDISPGSDYWRRLRMDGQLSIYFDGARALGYDPAGCIYDVIGKPGIKPLRATPTEERKYTLEKKCSPKKCPGPACEDCGGSGVIASRLYANQRDRDEAPGEHAERLREDIAASPEKYYQRGEVVRLETELATNRRDVWDLGRLIAAGRAPRNPDACLHFGRACEYLPVCSGEGSLDDPGRYRKREPHPELQGGLE